MERYKNRSGTSGVISYEIGPDYIHLKFRGGRAYRYDYTEPGRLHVEKMKELARSGAGLSTYVSQHVKSHFATAIRTAFRG